MKTEPTDIDREAALLFVLAPGMRASYSRRGLLGWGWLIDTDEGLWLFCENWPGFTVDSVDIDALDTDDPATVGCMLSQVEDAAAARVDLVWQWSGKGVVEWRAQWQRDDDIGVGHSGPTRGAALVAAMRSINKSKGDK